VLGVKVIFFCTARRSPRSSAAPCFARRSPHWPLRPPRTRRCAAPRCGQGDVKVAVYELRITPDYLPGAQKRNKCSQHYTQHALPTHAHFINKHWLQAGLCARDLAACCAPCARVGLPPPHHNPHSPNLAHARPRPTPDHGSPRCSAGTPNPPGRHESCGCCAAPRLSRRCAAAQAHLGVPAAKGPSQSPGLL